MPNHWTDDGDLVIEDRTLFRQVGWLGQTGTFYAMEDCPESLREPGGYAPVYRQIATDLGEGWKD